MTPAMQNLAAEYALGLASGRDLARATTLLRENFDFRDEVGAWVSRLTPLFEELDAVAPPPALWARIDAQLGSRGAANDNVGRLQREMRLWRGVTAMMTALAACFALLLLFRPAQQVFVPTPAEPVRQASAPMVAMVGEDQHDMMFVANWDPSSQQLVLAMAGDPPPADGMSHELWVISPKSGPTSLGVMPDDKKMHMKLAEQLADLLTQGATIAISREPPGGSPTGKPTGPVMWSGKLQST